jgi:hypothetical protein
MKLFQTCVFAALITLLGTSSALADDGPTVSDAHQFIGDLVQKGVLSDPHLVVSYKGEGCHSQFLNENSSSSINWSDITSVEISNYSVSIAGSIHFNPGRNNVGLTERIQTKYSAHTPDELTVNRLAKAMNVLKSSCAKKSKFD